MELAELALVEASRRVIIVVKHNIVVVLLNVLRQTEVLPQESEQLGRRTVVGKFGRLDCLTCQHRVEQMFTVASALHRCIHEEVEHAQWFHLHDVATPVAHEQSLLPDFDEADAPVAFALHVDCVPVCAEFSEQRDRVGQRLGLFL